jgi:hypothetical protein
MISSIVASAYWESVVNSSPKMRSQYFACQCRSCPRKPLDDKIIRSSMTSPQAFRGAGCHRLLLLTIWMIAYSQAPGTGKKGMQLAQGVETLPGKAKKRLKLPSGPSPFLPAAAEGVPFDPQVPGHRLHTGCTTNAALVLGGEEVLRRDSRWTSWLAKGEGV